MRRLGVVGLVVGLCAAGMPAVACGDEFQGDGDDDTTSGGTSGDGAGGAAGANDTGGSTTSGGTAQGGDDPGGADPGGTTATGGVETGGTSTGGTSTGGASTGGASTGGASTGGAPIAGASMGGATSGGRAGATSGGAGTGGAGGRGGLGGGGNEPVSTDHLVYWFSADVGVTQSGGVVSRWSDRSPNASDAAQLTNGTRPVLATLGGTQLPAIRFDGVDDYFGLPPLTASFTQGVTFFAVARAVTTPMCMSLMQLSNGSEIDDVSFDWHEGALQYEVLTDFLIGQDDAFGVGESRLLGVTEAAAGNVTLWVNGLSTGVGQFELPAVVARNQTFIARSLYVGCPTFGGEIAEILLYARALPQDERRTIEAYLQNKWLCCGS